MTTLKAAVVPAKVLKNGKHRIRIAIGHKQETRYIVTRFEIDNTANFKGGQVVGVFLMLHMSMLNYVEYLIHIRMPWIK